MSCTSWRLWESAQAGISRPEICQPSDGLSGRWLPGQFSHFLLVCDRRVFAAKIWSLFLGFAGSGHKRTEQVPRPAESSQTEFKAASIILSFSHLPPRRPRKSVANSLQSGIRPETLALSTASSSRRRVTHSEYMSPKSDHCDNSRMRRRPCLVGHHQQRDGGHDRTRNSSGGPFAGKVEARQGRVWDSALVQLLQRFFPLQWRKSNLPKQTL
jgi:hypothetical protein